MTLRLPGAGRPRAGRAAGTFEQRTLQLALKAAEPHAPRRRQSTREEHLRVQVAGCRVSSRCAGSAQGVQGPTACEVTTVTTPCCCPVVPAREYDGEYCAAEGGRVWKEGGAAAEIGLGSAQRQGLFRFRLWPQQLRLLLSATSPTEYYAHQAVAEGWLSGPKTAHA